eukprot:12891236-Prorocentrum_lima.AAC.1
MTHLVIDMLACVFRLSRAIGDISQAFLHFPEDEDIYERPPEEWTLREEKRARSEGRQWRPE